MSLSDAALEALRRDCEESGVPVMLEDDTTAERIAALLRSGS